MTRIIYLTMFLSMCMTVNLYAQSKKQLREMNGTLQHQSDSLVGVTENQALQIQELQRQIDSVTNANNSLNITNEQLKIQNESLTEVNQQLSDINKQLSAQVEKKQKEASQERAKVAKEKAYIENKEYYVTQNGRYCEWVGICKTWASNMAKVSGTSFKIVDIQVVNKSGASYSNHRGTDYHYNVNVSIQYLLNTKAYEKRINCTESYNRVPFEKEYEAHWEIMTCKWI